MTPKKVIANWVLKIAGAVAMCWLFGLVIMSVVAAVLALSWVLGWRRDRRRQRAADAEVARIVRRSEILSRLLEENRRQGIPTTTATWPKVVPIYVKEDDQVKPTAKTCRLRPAKAAEVIKANANRA